jgi:hypothetical protein
MERRSMIRSARGILGTLAIGLSGMAVSMESVRADILDTQIFGTFGAWTAYRDLYDDGEGWSCAVQSDAVDPRTGQEASLIAFSTYLAFVRVPDLSDREEVYFVTDEAAFQFYVDENVITAFSQDVEDFLALYALANTGGRVATVVVRNAQGSSGFDFPANGFRDAYRIIGQACDFDTTLVLDAEL